MTPREGPAAFDRLADVYDALTSAPARAVREAALLRDLLAPREVRRVYDAACGPGHHLRALADLGLDVAGSDGSPAMVARARQLVEDADIEVLDLAREPRGRVETHDAVLCIGNSLPCVGGLADVRRALRTLLRRTRPGGTLLVHAQNLARRESGRTWSGPVRAGSVDGREMLLLRHYVRARAAVRMDVVLLARTGDAWEETIVPVRLAVISPDWLRDALRAEGASRVRMMGDLAGGSFRAGSSPDVFALATRRVR